MRNSSRKRIPIIYPLRLDLWLYYLARIVSQDISMRSPICTACDQVLQPWGICVPVGLNGWYQTLVWLPKDMQLDLQSIGWYTSSNGEVWKLSGGTPTVKQTPGMFINCPLIWMLNSTLSDVTCEIASGEKGKQDSKAKV